MPHAQPDGFLAVPPSGKGRGVLVLHPWWGLNETIRAFCLKLSEAGFIAFAADLYHGKLATTIPEADRLSNELDAKAARRDIAEAVGFLSAHADPGGRGLGVVGFSLGAYFALEVSATNPDHIRAAVSFYGTRGGDYAASKAEYLAHFAEADEYEPESNVTAFEAALRKAGRPFTFHLYPGTGHWFFEPDRTDAYKPAAAALAWDRTLAFLHKSLPLAGDTHA